jgi:hypothetical protein
MVATLTVSLLCYAAMDRPDGQTKTNLNWKSTLTSMFFSLSIACLWLSAGVEYVVPFATSSLLLTMLACFVYYGLMKGQRPQLHLEVGAGVSLLSVLCIAWKFAWQNQQGDLPESLNFTACLAQQVDDAVVIVTSSPSPSCVKYHHSALCPALQAVAGPALLTGALWSVGNLCSIYAVETLGLSVGFPLVQCQLIVSTAWAVLYYREVPWQLRTVLAFVGSTLVAVAGMLLLAIFGT